MLRKRYWVTCDTCGRTPHGITMYQDTSAAARRDATHQRWQRIPRDRSRGQRGMDLCPRDRMD